MDYDEYNLIAFDHEYELANVRAPTATSWRVIFPDVVPISHRGPRESWAQRYQRASDKMVARIRKQGDRLATLVSEEVGRPVIIARIYESAGNVIVELVAMPKEQEGTP